MAAYFVSGGSRWKQVLPEDEVELERAVVQHASQIFGHNRIYIDCKRRIGSKEGTKNIPDGYLLDLASRTDPRLYVVENEISSHEPFKHIGVQLLEFSVSFKAAPRRVKEILLEEIGRGEATKIRCEDYARAAGLRNLDNMLTHLVEDEPFRAIVVIDEADAELFSLIKNFGFSVEVVEFELYRTDKNDRAYRFTPFQAEVEESIGAGRGTTVDISELDTVVVPAREDGFQETFVAENRWHKIRMSPSMIPQVKQIAAYRVAPTSAITHLARVATIEPWLDTGKYVVNFDGPAREIGPLRLVPKGKVKALQNLRYTTYAKITAAKDLDGAF